MNDSLPKTSGGEQTQAVPIPPRYWWLKRIMLASALLVTVLAIVRWRWGVYASKALQAEIDSYVAAGQPVYETDFVGPSLPDDQNAAVLLREAAQQFKALRDAHPEWPKPHLVLRGLEPGDAQAQAILAATAGIRERIHEAAEIPKVSWSVDVREIVEISDLMDLLALCASVQHRDGKNDEALATLRDLLNCGRHAGENRALLGSLVYAAAINNAVDGLESILPELSIEPARSDFGERANDLRRQLLQDLIESMGDSSLHMSLVQGLYRERTFQITALRTVLDDPSFLPGSRFGIADQLMMPMYQLDGVRALRQRTAMIQAMSAPNLPAFEELAPGKPGQPDRSIRSMAHALSMFGPHHTESLIKHWHTMARLRAAQIALAVRLYEVDHGSLPGDLNELVPPYLPQVPRNPLGDQPLELERTDQWTRVLAANQVVPREGERFYLKGKPRKTSATKPGASRTKAPASATRPR